MKILVNPVIKPGLGKNAFPPQELCRRHHLYESAGIPERQVLQEAKFKAEPQKSCTGF